MTNKHSGSAMCAEWKRGAGLCVIRECWELYVLKINTKRI